MYSEDEMLMLSGIQHFVFCPRQWALIHIEQQWAENRLTAEGRVLHQNVDNPSYRQKNGDVVTLRSVPISSKTLGLYGYTDAIELRPSENQEDCITHHKYPNCYWKPCPIEYKRGHSKPDDRDRVQLAAQVICLEEYYGIKINTAYLYYGETNRREEVAIDGNLRELTQRCADEMHNLIKTGTVPKAEKKRCCQSCSLVNACLPEMSTKQRVFNYLKKNLYEETT